METLARAKELGITSDAVLDRLGSAVIKAADDYAKSFESEGVEVTIDGQPVQTFPLMQLSPKSVHGLNKPVQPKLQGPEDTQSDE